MKFTLKISALTHPNADMSKEPELRSASYEANCPAHATLLLTHMLPDVVMPTLMALERLERPGHFTVQIEMGMVDDDAILPGKETVQH